MEGDSNTNAEMSRQSTGGFTCNDANPAQPPVNQPTPGCPSSASAPRNINWRAYVERQRERASWEKRMEWRRLNPEAAASNDAKHAQAVAELREIHGENWQPPAWRLPPGPKPPKLTMEELTAPPAPLAPRQNNTAVKRKIEVPDDAEVERRRKRLEKEEMESCRIGKILVGDKTVITAKTAQDELLSLLPGGVKMGVFLAEGGFGKVFMVDDEQTGEVLAAKVCMHYGKERDFRLFVQEGRMQRLFNHENICRAYSYGYGPNIAITFLEFLNGAELFDLIPHKVGLALDKAFDYFSQALDGLEYLHNFGFAHLDIKPENIIVTCTGVAKLVDFGHGVMYRHAYNLRLITGRRGTRPYMAPETVTGEQPYDPCRVDIFSLGITLMTVVTGERIWKEPRSRDKLYHAWCRKRTDEVRQFRRLPPDLLSFLRGMLEPEPAKRKAFPELRQHVWFRTGLNGGLQQEPLRSADARLGDRHMSASQPASSLVFSGGPAEAAVATVADGGISFSQPVGRRYCGPQLCHLADERPERGFNPKCIMRRLTRFFSQLDASATLQKLLQAIDAQVHVKSRVRGSGDIVIESRAKTDPFVARVVLILFPGRLRSRDGDVLVEFRRASGDEFAFLEMYHSILRTLTRMKVVAEEHPYLEMLNAEHPRLPAPPPSSEEAKEKTT